MKTADKIRIELKDIMKLQRLYIDIFSEEDEDYPDNRVINNKERAVQILGGINIGKRIIWWKGELKSGRK